MEVTMAWSVSLPKPVCTEIHLRGTHYAPEPNGPRGANQGRQLIALGGLIKLAAVRAKET